MIYRALVAVQTLGWGATSLVRIITRPPAVSLGTQPIALTLTVVSVVGVAGAVLSYYLRGSQSPARDAVVVAWVWLQLAGFAALAAYATTGAPICFLIGMLTLAAMHAFSPNRFQRGPGT